MLGTPTEPRTPSLDSGRSALAFLHRLLILPTEEQTNRDESPSWGEQLDRGIRRQRMDAAAHVARRLAHDFGNILTGILGFSELALAHQIAPDSPLHVFLSEIHRGAENGAQYLDLLRLFARRQTMRSHTERGSEKRGSLVNVLAALRDEWGADVQLQLHLPADLPFVAVESAALRQVLAIVLDNAREAIAGAGVIDVSAQTIQMNAWEARELFGAVRPGTHVEIRVADSGSGLTPEAQRQLFAEPFFSTKPRQRGFGLAIAYGILSAQRGGLELLRRPEGGTTARLVVPVAAVSAPSLS